MYLLGMLKKILTNQKTLHIMKRLAVKSQNEGATSDAETLHNMKRLFIRAMRFLPVDTQDSRGDTTERARY